MTEPLQMPQKPVLAEPRCPHCKRVLQGMNVAGMKLPVAGPDGKTIVQIMTFTMPCCPYPDCACVLAVQLIGTEAPAESAVPGLWVPPAARA